MQDKTSRQILMIKQEYNISDNDPVFALLDVYGSLLKDLDSVLHSVKGAQSIAYKALNEIKQEKDRIADFLKDQEIETLKAGVKVGNVLTEEMNMKLVDFFKCIDEYKKGINQERQSLSSDRFNHDHNLKTLFAQYNEYEDAQKTKNNIAFALIALMILMQSVSIVTLLNFIG